MLKALGELIWKHIENKNMPPGAKIVLSLISLLTFIVVSTMFFIINVESEAAARGLMQIAQTLFTGVLAITACSVAFYMASTRSY